MEKKNQLYDPLHFPAAEQVIARYPFRQNQILQIVPDTSLPDIRTAAEKEDTAILPEAE